MKKILIIDDDSDDQEILADILGSIQQGLELKFADNGLLGLAHLHDTDYVPDLIFLDVNMPKMNGREFLLEFSAMEHMKAVPVVIYSTAVDDYSMDHFKKIGAKNFISKSSDLRMVEKAISKILNQ